MDKFTHDEALKNIKKTREQYPFERMSKFLKKIEICSQTISCKEDPEMYLSTSDDQYKNIYISHLIQQGFSPEIIKYGGQGVGKFEILRVQNTWNSHEGKK